MQNIYFQDGNIDKDFWNENLTWNSAVPDFTECFQQVVFVLIPYSVFCAIGAVNIWLNSKRPVHTGYSWTVLCVLKMILCAALILISVLEISLLPHRKLLESNVRDITIASNCVQIIAYIIILILLKQNACRKAQRAPMVLTIFWFIFSICNAFRYRSSFLRAFNVAFASTPADDYILNMVQFPLIICQLFFSLFNDPVSNVKQSFLEDSSFFSIFTFFWLNKYIYRSRKRLLTVEDIQPLSPQLHASGLYEKFQRQWTKALHKRAQQRSQSGEEPKESALFLAYILTKAVWPYFAVGCVMQLAYDFLIFLPPLLLDKTIAFVSGNDYAWKGYFYCASLFLSSLATQSGFTFLLFFSALYAFQVKSIVISAIYHKAIKLSSFARRSYTVGEMVNLMSVDADNLYMMAIYSNLLFGAPLKLILTIAMLWQYLGPSCLAGGAVLILMMLCGYFVHTRTTIMQEKQMNMKDSRLKQVNETLSGIKVLKLYAWEIPFMDKISLIRDKEVNFIRVFQLLFAGSVFLWNCGPFVIGLASLVTYVLVDEKHVLNATTVFVSINLLSIFQHVVQEIPELIAKVAQAKVTLTRVMKFLIAEERKTDEIGKNCIAGEAITVQKGAFSWSNDGQPNLSDINFHVPTGSLIAVTGPVGAGKSSLLSALLGEMVKKSGSIDINGTIAYVPQQAWILNRTVRDNILFVNKMNKNKYDAILDNCCLRPDLEILPGGDKTEIGEKGVNLSGGQKQRVSLARAIFHDAEIYLLDDPLSALDSHVGKHIFEHVIGKNGILKNKTRILVTHNINVLPETDFIVTMKEGKIHEAGTYNQLIESAGVFADFMTEHSTVKEVDEDSEEKMFESGGDLKIEHKKSINDGGPVARSISVESTTSATSAKLVEEEGMEVGEIKRVMYINYAKHVGILLLFGMLSGYFAAVALDISINFWLSSWSADPILDDGTQDIKQRNHRITIYAVLGICKSIIKAAAGICLAFGSARAAKIYHKEMLQSILKAPMSFFDTTPLGRIVNRFGRDIDDVDTQMSMQLDAYVACLFYALGTIIVISISTPLFLAFLVPLLVLYYIIQICYLKTSRQLKRLYAITRSPIYSHFSETVNGTSSVRAYRVENQFRKTADEKLNANITCQLFSFMCCRWLEFHLGVIGNLIVLITAILAVESRGVLEVGVIGLSITYALTIVDDLTWIVYSGSELENKFVSIERIEEYSTLPSEAPWTVSKSFPPSTWPSQGKLEFKGYSTRYREGLDLVIKNINLNIGENEKVGIVGRTGAGKSSFALALFRIIEPVEGTTLIDDVDVSQIGLHQLRSKLTIIPQDPVLFTGPLRMNLDPNDTYSDDEIWSSLESAHLKNFVSSLAEGLNYDIAEGGENLSVGQRQLLCLARALLKQAKILILDEATAAVDMETDRLIQNTIRSEFKEYTVITIAHRLNTIMDYDKVVVMDSGEIAEVGNPSELIQRPSSHFYNMAKDAGLL